MKLELLSVTHKGGLEAFSFNCAQINKLQHFLVLHTSLQALPSSKTHLCLVTLNLCSITPAD